MKVDGLHTGLVSIGSSKKDSDGILHEKDVMKPLQKKIECYGREDIIFGPGLRLDFSRVVFPGTPA